MAPLLEAHILAQMNGMAFDANDPVYFWQTAAFAVDNCGMTFYSAETTGSAPNPREDNTVFIYSIRTVKQIS